MDRVTELGGDDQGTRRYRRRTVEEKCQIVRETLVPGRSVAEVARAHEVNANQVFDWRKQYLEGRLDPKREDGLRRTNSMAFGHRKSQGKRWN